MDEVFKALADPTRRYLLDRLHEHNGQTLGSLCERVAMTRQATSHHLVVLEAANLVSTRWRGREKLHYLNPVPLHEIEERWIDKFERPRLRALNSLKRQSNDAMTEHPHPHPTYVSVTYIASTAERVWEALTDPDMTAAYWGHRNVSDWRAGSSWAHHRADGTDDVDVEGTVLESIRPRRLVMSWAEPGRHRLGGPSRVTFEIDVSGPVVRLTVTHEELEDDAELHAVASGWPVVVSNLKSLLETGSPLPPDLLLAGQR
jgi:uncharacterized protein YndB with AHSA1/START domain/DNA-binding transcriptional ArsR family regulator